MTPRTPADWSLPAASFSAPVLGSDQSACPASGNYILISRSSCPTNGVHFKGSGMIIEDKNLFLSILPNFDRSIFWHWRPVHRFIVMIE